MKLIVGNWKMNGLRADGRERSLALVAKFKGEKPSGFNMVLCPPTSLLSETSAQIANSGLFLGGQDCHTAASGAFTGDISAAMLKDIGCTYVILGHSERRQYHKEDDALIAAKATAANSAGLISIICVGETDAERSAGQQKAVVQKQLKNALPAGCSAENTVIAYEPVWAIGTGKTASTADIAAMHAHIRGLVPAGMKILYGGSVKSSNAAEILSTPNVDGALVGGASLKADEFWAIATAV